jgi:CBS domain-containing protein
MGVKNLTVRGFLDSLSRRVELPVVAAGSSLKEVVCAMVKGHRRRIVYVVDSEGKLKGAISLDDLKDVIFRFYLKGRVNNALVVSEHIAELFASEKAEDVMDTAPPVCGEHEKLETVLGIMIERNVKDMPVIDQNGRVIADLDILDLLELWLKKGEVAF